MLRHLVQLGLRMGGASHLSVMKVGPQRCGKSRLRVETHIPWKKLTLQTQISCSLGGQAGTSSTKALEYGTISALMRKLKFKRLYFNVKPAGYLSDPLSPRTGTRWLSIGIEPAPEVIRDAKKGVFGLFLLNHIQRLSCKGANCVLSDGRLMENSSMCSRLIISSPNVMRLSKFRPPTHMP